MYTQGTPVPLQLPGIGQIPSAQTRGISPASGVQATGGVATEQGISAQQYDELRKIIRENPETNAQEKLILHEVINKLQELNPTENTPLNAEQQGTLAKVIENSTSKNVKQFTDMLIKMFEPQATTADASATSAVGTASNNATTSDVAAPVDNYTPPGAQEAAQGKMEPVMMSYAPSKPKSLFERIAAALTMLFTGKQSASDDNQITMRPLSSFEPVGTPFSGGQAPVGTQGTASGNATVNTAASSNYPVPTGDFYEKSPYHDPNQFVPRFPMIAYHESGVMREQGDAYAVGGISNPSRGEDLGGKTYGVYQFESSTYADGSTSGNSSQSTLARFINSPNNPYGAQLQAAAQAHGLGSAGFDQVWKQLAGADNKAFGEAQESFMLQETESKAADFFERAGLSEEIRNDPAMVDLVLGTINQVGGLATSAADHLKSVAASRGRPLTAAEASQTLIEFKKDNISNWFQSSPGAQQGVRNRYEAELIAMNGQYSNQDTDTMLA